MKPIIVIKLTPFSYAALINLGNKIIVALTGNLFYTTPLVPLSSLQTAVDDTTNAYALWAPPGGRGSREQLLDLRNKARTLYQLLQSEAGYVQGTAQVASGSDYSLMAVMIGTSGYDLKNAPIPQGMLEMVQNFHRFVSRTLPINQMKLKWKKPLNVTSDNNVHDYRIMRGTTAVFSDATEIASTTGTSFIDINTSDAPQTWTYWIVPFNNAGLGVPSDPITVTIYNV